MKIRTVLFSTAAFAVGIAQPLHAQFSMETAEEWYKIAAEVASDRLEDVDTYVERVKGGAIPGLDQMPGQDGPKCTSACRVHQTEQVEAGDGTTRNVAHLLTPMEAAILAGVSPEAEEMVGYSLGMEIAQDAISDNATQMLGPWAGIAETVFGKIPEDTSEVVDDVNRRSWEQDERESPWLNPFRLFGAGSLMFAESARATAEAQTSLGESGSQAQAELAMMEAFLMNAILMGFETIDGVQAMYIKAPIPDDVAQEFAASQAQPGQPSFLPKTSNTWIAADTYVVLRHRLDGIASMDGESKEFFIENVNQDYREVAGSDLYMPYRRVMRMGGVLTDEQKAELAEASEQLAEFDRELAAMPPDQRKMVEDMMGGQMATLRSLATTGTFEFVEEIEEILVNPDLKALFTVMPSGAAPDNILPQVQAHLVTLGYAPGNTNGVLDTMTQVAISQYQAEAGLQVTGEPSEVLLDALRDSVASQ